MKKKDKILAIIIGILGLVEGYLWFTCIPASFTNYNNWETLLSSGIGLILACTAITILNNLDNKNKN